MLPMTSADRGSLLCRNGITATGCASVNGTGFLHYDDRDSVKQTGENQARFLHQNRMDFPADWNNLTAFTERRC